MFEKTTALNTSTYEKHQKDFVAEFVLRVA